MGRQAGPRDFGGGEGDAAMAQAVAQVGQVTEKMLDLQQTTKVNSAVAESAVALSQLESAELELEYLNIPRLLLLEEREFENLLSVVFKKNIHR